LHNKIEKEGKTMKLKLFDETVLNADIQETEDI
jgi:hypothetical protein